MAKTRVRQNKLSESGGGVTLKDVAKLAGVAPVTVSYVLNNKASSIGAATRERVLAAALEIGYRPNMAARSLVTRRTQIIALWVPDVASSFSARVIDEIQKQARAKGYDVLFSEIHWEREAAGKSTVEGELPPATVKMPLWNVDGIIAFLTSSCRNVRLDPQVTNNTPMVVMGSFPLEESDYVGVELYSQARKAMEWLLAQQRRHIAFLVPGQVAFPDDERHQAYSTVIGGAGLEPVTISMRENSRAAARTALSDYLQTNKPLDAIFCYNDDAAIGAYRALRDVGLRIPDDVLLVGCDGIEDIDYLDWPLNTLELPIVEMCATAWRFLEQRIGDNGLARQTRIFSSQLKLANSNGIEK